MRDAAAHVKKNDALGLRRKVRRLGCKRVDRKRSPGNRRRATATQCRAAASSRRPSTVKPRAALDQNADGTSSATLNPDRRIRCCRRAFEIAPRGRAISARSCFSSASAITIFLEKLERFLAFTIGGQASQYVGPGSLDPLCRHGQSGRQPRRILFGLPVHERVIQEVKRLGRDGRRQTYRRRRIGIGAVEIAPGTGGV